MTVIAKRCPFHVFWETKIKIVAVSTYFRLHNDETERSRHRKKNHDALFSVETVLWVTKKHIEETHQRDTLVSLTLPHFIDTLSFLAF